jgi:hypothetical protein
MEHVSVVWWVAFGGILTVIALSLAATRETVRLAVPSVGGPALEPVSLGLAAVAADGGEGGGVVGEGDHGGAGDAGGHSEGSDGHGGGEGGDGGSGGQ